MSIFGNPIDHAANPPETWFAVKRGERHWALMTKDAHALDYFPTKREALAARERGHIFTLYRNEGRWYAGEEVRPWRPYADLLAEYDREHRSGRHKMPSIHGHYCPDCRELIA